MKLKLIAPARKLEWGDDFWNNKSLVEPAGKKATGPLLALPTLAALTPLDVEVTITDERVEPINFDEKVDLVGISFFTSLAPRAYEIADEFRAKGVPVVLGGIHASMLPEEAIQHADSVVIGEAEDIWSKLIDDLQKGKLQKFYQAPCFPDLKNSPIPRWDLLKTDAYNYFTVQTGRGCPYDCDFCSVKIFNGRKYRHKPISNIVREIKTLQKIDPRKGIFFADDNLLAVPSYAKALLEAITPLKIKAWWCQSSINRLKDDKLLDLIYKAGCRVVFIGFESVSPQSLKSMNKSKVNKVEEYKEVVEKVHSHGIAICGSFIFGNDTDDETVFEETGKFIDDTNIGFSLITLLTPLPGTKLFQKLREEGRIIHHNWEKYNLETVCFKPKFMSPQVLQNRRNQMMQQIYSYEALYKRLANLWKQRVFVREKSHKLFTKGRVLFTMKYFLNTDFKRLYFILKSLWNPAITSISSVIMALSFHDYAYTLRESTKTAKARKR